MSQLYLIETLKKDFQNLKAAPQVQVTIITQTEN